MPRRQNDDSYDEPRNQQQGYGRDSQRNWQQREYQEEQPAQFFNKQSAQQQPQRQPDFNNMTVGEVLNNPQECLSFVLAAFSRLQSFQNPSTLAIEASRSSSQQQRSNLNMQDSSRQYFPSSRQSDSFQREDTQFCSIAAQNQHYEPNQSSSFQKYSSPAGRQQRGEQLGFFNPQPYYPEQRMEEDRTQNGAIIDKYQRMTSEIRAPNISNETLTDRNDAEERNRQQSYYRKLAQPPNNPQRQSSNVASSNAGPQSISGRRQPLSTTIKQQPTSRDLDDETPRVAKKQVQSTFTSADFKNQSDEDSNEEDSDRERQTPEMHNRPSHAPVPSTQRFNSTAQLQTRPAPIASSKPKQSDTAVPSTSRPTVSQLNKQRAARVQPVSNLLKTNESKEINVVPEGAIRKVNVCGNDSDSSPSESDDEDEASKRLRHHR